MGGILCSGNPEPKDIIDLQSRIAQAIAAELHATLSPQEKRLIENSPTTDLRAYDFYQRGEEQMRRYNTDGNSRTLNQAEEFYRRALEHDPAFTWAYVGRGWYYREKMDRKKSIRELTKAIKINPNLWQAYYNRGIMYPYYVPRFEDHY